MKHFIIIAFIIIGYWSCTVQRQKSYATNTNPIKDSIMFEKFNFELDKTDYVGYEYAEDSYNSYGANGFYKLKNGGVFNPDEGVDYYSYYVVPPLPSYFSFFYRYFRLIR
ncbi:hypothetical protein ACM39_17715 [Chryseobacterium sp. FH2]|nr:hypothetical protein ACM39_17715 [Chryseobacterium sp. FH2]